MCLSVDCLPSNRPSTEKHNTHQLRYTSWWWATNMPETYRGWLTKKLLINSASSWFSLRGSNRDMTCFLGGGSRMYRLCYNGQRKVGYWTITAIFIQSQQQRSQLSQHAWRNSHRFCKIEHDVKLELFHQPTLINNFL